MPLREGSGAPEAPLDRQASVLAVEVAMQPLVGPRHLAAEGGCLPRGPGPLPSQCTETLTAKPRKASRLEEPPPGHPARRGPRPRYWRRIQLARSPKGHQAQANRHGATRSDALRASSGSSDAGLPKRAGQVFHLGKRS